MTLLRINKGVDTGPIYGYYRCDFDESIDSHVIIQNKVVLDNLDGLRDKLFEIADGRAATLDTTGRASAEWGQPWLTSYLAWKSRAMKGGRC
jgi:methionyl-tRNA formyltransferase